MQAIADVNKNNNTTEADAAQSSHFEEHAISRKTFVWLVGSLCQMNRQPFDEGLLIQQFVPPYSTTTILSALRELGYEPQIHYPVQTKDFSRHIPGIVLLKNHQDDAPAASEPSETKPDTRTSDTPLSDTLLADQKVPVDKAKTPVELGLLLRSDGERLLWTDSSSQTTHTGRIDEAVSTAYPDSQKGSSGGIKPRF